MIDEGPDDAAEVSLPRDRAFVVQLGTGAAPGVRGRVEHLASGRALRFDSWEALREFLIQSGRTS